jgi:hypothetical protein
LRAAFLDRVGGPLLHLEADCLVGAACVGDERDIDGIRAADGPDSEEGRAHERRQAHSPLREEKTADNNAHARPKREPWRLRRGFNAPWASEVLYAGALLSVTICNIGTVERLLDDYRLKWNAF